MQGIQNVFPDPIVVPAAFEAEQNSREVYWRVRRGIDGLQAHAMQGSAALGSVVWADALARVPSDQPISAGDPIERFSFDSLLA